MTVASVNLGKLKQRQLWRANFVVSDGWLGTLSDGQTDRRTDGRMNGWWWLPTDCRIAVLSLVWRLNNINPFNRTGIAIVTFFWGGGHNFGHIYSIDVQSSSSISTFRQRLKTFLFQKSFPDIVIWYILPTNYVMVDFEMAITILATLKIVDWLTTYRPVPVVHFTILWAKNYENWMRIDNEKKVQFLVHASNGLINGVDDEDVAGDVTKGHISRTCCAATVRCLWC